MKKAIKNNILGRTLSFIVILTASSVGLTQSPSMLRQTLSQTGSSTSFHLSGSSFIIQESIGQNSPSGIRQGQNFTLRQGFIQPDNLTFTFYSNKEENFSGIVYPNPFQSYITIEFEEQAEERFQIEIFDLSGRLVFEEQINTSIRIDLQLENIARGSYILNINTSDKKFTTNIQKL